MKIVLNSIELQNFKGFAKASKFFGSEQETIAAENGQGKTTLRDAWFWLLGFNVNDIIPSRDNKEIPNLDIVVTAEVSITDTTGECKYTFSREQKEVRKTNKDTGIEEKVNNESSYFIDGTPFTLRNYKEKIAELFGVPYDKLQMLSQKEYFNTDNGEKWKWVNRRKELFELCKVDELLADMVNDERYSLIAGDIRKKYSTTEIKKAIAKELKGYAADKERNTILISDKQNEIAKYNGIDFVALETEKAGIESQITDAMVANAKTVVNEKLAKWQEGKAILTEQIFRIRAEDAHTRGELEAKISALNAELTKTQSRAESLKADMASAQSSVKSLEEEVAKLTASEWKGDTICPTCKQTLPAEVVEESKRNFEADRQSKIKSASELIDSKLDFLLTAKDTLAEYRETYANLRSQKTAYENQIAEIKTADKLAPLEEQLQEINAQIGACKAADAEANKKDVSAVVEPLKRRVSEINSLLGYKKIIAEFASRVDQLKELNRELTDREMTAKTKVRQLDEYVKEQVKTVTSTINSIFHNGVSFSLFSDLYAGSEHEIKEECICVLNGKTYNEMSYGERFFADLEVTKALQAQYGVSLPIFLDNAECFTGEVEAEQQLILLYAKKGALLDGIKIEVIL